MSKYSSSKTNPFLIFLLVISVGFVGSLYLMNRSQKPSDNQTNTNIQPTLKPTNTPVPTATPTPTPKPIPHGAKSFIVSVGNMIKGPRMGKGTIDPYDPKLNEEQQLTIEVADQTLVNKVTVTLKSDHKTSGPFELSLINGDRTSGNWQGKWTVEDSYLYTYVLTIKAYAPSGVSSVDFTLR